MLYADEAHLAAVAVPLLRAGVAAGELVCVVTEHNDLLRDALGSEAEHVDFVDPHPFFARPGDTLASYQRLVKEHLTQPGARARVLAEAVWCTRGATEVTEWERFDAAANAAFAHAPLRAVCCYDQRRAPPAVQTAAAQTHPRLLHSDGSDPSPQYVAPERYIEQLEDELALPAPPASATERLVGGDLPNLRGFVRDGASRAALSTDRADDAVIVVNELVTNLLRHSVGEGRLLTWEEWNEERRFVCELRDASGNRPPPLAGYVDAPPEHTGGSGLALVRQLADLAPISHDDEGSAIRVVFRET